MTSMGNYKTEYPEYPCTKDFDLNPLYLLLIDPL